MRTRVLYVPLLLLLASAPAAADDLADCRSGDLDRSIEGCSRIIQAGKQGKAILSAAYNGRGHAYNEKRDYDRAIADLNEAIRLDARNVAAFNNRGRAYVAKRDYARGIADLDQAIRLDPRHAIAFINRGSAHTESGNYERALADLNEAIRLNPKTAGAYNNRGHILFELKRYDTAIADFSEAIRLSPMSALAYNNRGRAYAANRDWDRALTDLGEAIRINPAYAVAYNNRGHVQHEMGSHEQAIADFTEAIRINPSYANAYGNRGHVYSQMQPDDKALADLTEAIRLDPSHAPAYNHRGRTYGAKRDFAHAISDLNEAIRLNPKLAAAYVNRGHAYSETGDNDRAIADLNEAIRLDAKQIGAYRFRGKAFEAVGQKDRAAADYRTALELPASDPSGRTHQESVRERLALLTQPTTPPQESTGGRRVALVVGNAVYRNVPRLRNTGNDARAIAASLRRLGFAEVTERHDQGLADLSAALKEFGDRAVNAEWAVVYYAGHGIEVDGTAYLLPTDAKLLRDAHVIDEAVSLDRVLAKVEGARKLKLVILDACRNNPFLAQMERAGGARRSIGRGLSRIEPEGGVLVAYSAKHGTLADDGEGQHSPFAAALLAHLEEPGVEINKLFRKVRDRVLAATNRQQEPFVYGSLSSEDFYFKASPAAR